MKRLTVAIYSPSEKKLVLQCIVEYYFKLALQ